MGLRRQQRRDSRGAPQGHWGLQAHMHARSVGFLLQAQTPHLFAVVVARNRLPPRTTSA